MIAMDDTASVCYFRIHLTTSGPFYFQHKSSTHLAHNWHKLAHIWHKLARIWHTSGTQPAHLTTLATEAVSAGADARVGNHMN